MNETSVQPGWYPAPHANGEMRWWDGAQWVAPPTPPAKKSYWWVWLVVGVLVLGGFVGGILVLMVGVAASMSVSESADSADTVPEVDDGVRKPGDYKDYGDGLAARWANDAEQMPCLEGYARCATLMVYALESCETYAKANIVDSTGTVIGWTNALGGNLTAGDKAKIQFTTFEPEVDGFTLTNLECY